VLDGGEIKVFAPLGDDSVNNFEYSGDRKFNPALGELMTVNSFDIYGVAVIGCTSNGHCSPLTTAPHDFDAQGRPTAPQGCSSRVLVNDSQLVR